MSENKQEKKKITTLDTELYLLIAKYLSIGPCKGASALLRQEIEEHGLLPKRVDWLGNEHSRTFNELEPQLSQIADDHLLKICARIGPILDKEIPPTVPGLTSLLGVGRQSLLRTKEDLEKPKCQMSNLLVRKNGMPLLPSHSSQSSYPPNIVQVLISRETSGALSCRHTFTPKLYARQQSYRRLLGHLSSVYCVLFDRTGKYIFTGADDLLVKIWSSVDGRLLSSLRGHSAEITDMAISYDNTLFAAGSCDKTIRVWCLRTTAPVAVLCGHTGMVTSLQFCPYPKSTDKLLISTGNDGCVCFWHYNAKNVFNPKPLKFTERNKANAQMICSSFSSGGLFLATGSTDNNVRVYNIAGINGPEKILEREVHSDRVDSIQFSYKDCRFISGSKDGSALIWKYERQNWTHIQLKMSTKLPGQSEEPDDIKVKYRVTMVGWTLDDQKVITAVSDFSIKVWNSYNGNLCYILQGHEDEVFVLESHPIDPRVFLSSGHDGRIIIWDLVTGTSIKNHFNLIEGQGHGAVFDCKFSPDGLIFASTDSHGHLSIFGFGSAERYKKVPDEQFFHTDYRPLIRDIHHHVLDEQTQTAPHLLPPPFLVDIDGNPYAPNLQRLVPGREHLMDSQLVPYVAVSAEGDPEILQPVRSANDDLHNRPTIDDMIERLQQEREQHMQGGDLQENGGEGSSSAENNAAADALRSPLSSHRLGGGNGDQHEADPFSPRTPRSQAGHSRVGLRRTGDVEGVQSVGNWQSRSNQSDVPVAKRGVVKPMPASLFKFQLETRVILADNEVNFYNEERKRRPLMEMHEDSQSQDSSGLFQRRRGNRAGLRSHGQEEESNSAFPDGAEPSSQETNNSNSSSSSESEQQEDSCSSAESDYSDWEENARIPKKPKPDPQPSTSAGSSRRPATLRQSLKRRRRLVSSGDEESRDEDAELSQTEQADTSRGSKKKSTTPVKKESAKFLKLAERFRPPEWLTDVMPHKAPYVPQIGDEIVYFRQGHELYVQAVKRNRIYDIFMRQQPWRMINLRDQEVARIDDISFENHPPRLCCLKLTLVNPATKDESFTVKYHDMADVIDFIILKKTYDTAMNYEWKPGDRFRSAIDKAWWLGTIKDQKPLNANFPDSMFQCFIVKWDNGEKEQMSPWDFEPIDGDRLPDDQGGSVEITPDERAEMMYQPEPYEWSHYGQDHDCDRIARGLLRIMELRIGESFVCPVDLELYPTYAIVVEYPMDLGTIKARLQNRFYRRLDAVKFDVRYIALNAQKFNEPGSRIVKQAKCVVELCNRFIDLPHCTDPMDLYNEMMEAKNSRTQDSQSELDVLCSETDSDGDNNASARIKRKKQNALHSKKRVCLGNQKYTSHSWKQQCKTLIDTFYQCDDSTPFRQPVNLNEYPDYRHIIDNPVDLSMVREKLNNNMYYSPTDFCKDMRLIFQNSRTYNINKKSRIFSMTIRLSAMFEEHIRGIVSDWRSAVKYEEKIQNNQFVSNRRKPLLLQEDSVNVGASTSRSLPSSSRSFPTQSSSSRGETSRSSSSRNTNWHSESGNSRSHSNRMSNGMVPKKKLKSGETSPIKRPFANLKKKIPKVSIDTSLRNGVDKREMRVTKRKLQDRTPKKHHEIPKRKATYTEPDHSDSNASDPSDDSPAAPSESDDDRDWNRNKKKKRKENPTPKILRPRKVPSFIRHSQRQRKLMSYQERSPDHSYSQRPPVARSRHSTLLRFQSPENKSSRLRRRRETQKPLRYRESAASFDSDASDESPSLKDDPHSNSSSGSYSKRPPPRSTRTSTSQKPPPPSSSTSEQENSEDEGMRRKPPPKPRNPSALVSKRSPQKSRMQTRNRGQRTVQYQEGNTEEEDDSDSNRPSLRSINCEEGEQSPGMPKMSAAKSVKKDIRKMGFSYGGGSTGDENSNSKNNLRMRAKFQAMKHERPNPAKRKSYKVYRLNRADPGSSKTFKLNRCGLRKFSASNYGFRKSTELVKRSGFKRQKYSKFGYHTVKPSEKLRSNAVGRRYRKKMVLSEDRRSEDVDVATRNIPISLKTRSKRHLGTDDGSNSGDIAEKSNTHRPNIVFCKSTHVEANLKGKLRAENTSVAECSVASDRDSTSRNSSIGSLLPQKRLLKQRDSQKIANRHSVPRVQKPVIVRVRPNRSESSSLSNIENNVATGKRSLRKSQVEANSDKIQTRYKGQRTFVYRDDVEDIAENEDPVKQEEKLTKNSACSSLVHNEKTKQSKLSGQEASVSSKRISFPRLKKQALKTLSNGIETRNHGQRTTVYAEGDDDDYLEDYFENSDSE